jgi:hypothetical protein
VNPIIRIDPSGLLSICPVPGVPDDSAGPSQPVSLFEYLSIAVQIGVMTLNDVQEFSLDTTFIPGGCELGIYPTAWLYATLKKLKRSAANL